MCDVLSEKGGRVKSFTAGLALVSSGSVRVWVRLKVEGWGWCHGVREESRRVSIRRLAWFVQPKSKYK
jgi:hypothetical protein